MAFRFEGLEVFQLALEFARMVYAMTKTFPKEEVFGLTANVRRAATSIALNIAEGAGRGTRRDFMHFIDVATGSLFETVASFLIAERLGYVKPSDLDELREAADKLGRKLSSFKRSLSDDKR
ncbi:MAG TPA: four helix bundle protein [Candidatus Kryptonia bacterium]|nr:four helix bundle protein [Candidatus Kryptonia bacterium]